MWGTHSVCGSSLTHRLHVTHENPVTAREHQLTFMCDAMPTFRSLNYRSSYRWKDSRVPPKIWELMCEPYFWCNNTVTLLLSVPAEKN